MGRTTRILSESKNVGGIILIFVTVGTHEQNFNRLIKEIDGLKRQNIINDEVFIQTGFSDYTPKYCESKSIISFEEMEEYTKKARIIITHGGPGSIFLPIQMGKKPIVVPRNPEFDEHVDSHQIQFAQRMYNSNRVDLVLDIKDLKDCILNYENYSNAKYEDSTKEFINKFEAVVDSLFANKI